MPPQHGSYSWEEQTPRLILSVDTQYRCRRFWQPRYLPWPPGVACRAAERLITARLTTFSIQLHSIDPPKNYRLQSRGYGTNGVSALIISARHRFRPRLQVRASIHHVTDRCSGRRLKARFGQGGEGHRKAGAIFCPPTFCCPSLGKTPASRKLTLNPANFSPSVSRGLAFDSRWRKNNNRRGLPMIYACC